MVSFRGQKSLGHAQISLLWGFNTKFPTIIPTPFVCSVPLLGMYRQSGINMATSMTSICLKYYLLTSKKKKKETTSV